MLSHVIKKLLDKATGLKFSPVIGMSEQEPICSYNLTENTHEELNEATLETLRENVKENICSKETESNIVIDNYSLRIKPSGGGILRDNNYFDSTQFFIVKFYKKEKK